MKKIIVFNCDGVIEEKFVNGVLNDELLTEILDGDLEEIFYLKEFERMNISLLQNGSSKLMNQTPTIHVVRDGKLIDILCGKIIAVGTDEEEYVGLNQLQEKYVIDNVKTSTIALPTPFLIIEK